MKCPNCGKQGAVAISCSPKGVVQVYCNLCGEETGLPLWWAIGKGYDGTIVKKEEPTMKVEYNGFTGGLVKLERTFNGEIEIPVEFPRKPSHKWHYNLSIYDSEKQVTHSFNGVKLEDVKFLGGAVSFGG